MYWPASGHADVARDVSACMQMRGVTRNVFACFAEVTRNLFACIWTCFTGCRHAK